ncbi:p21-activated protein kinase-interacting protein 1-like [Amblyomma americanum]
MAALEDGENVFDVILGTYEEFVLGYSLQKGKDGQFKLHQFFTNHSHMGSVRCAASGGKFAASGSTDETIRLFNMRNRSEMGSLMQHEGTVTSLEFYKSSHLFSASDDKTICVWSTGSWQCLKTLRGHKAEVVSLAVHPSGKLLLSVSKDKTLRTWNLVKGRNAYITNIKAVADFVQWSPGGIYFVVGVGNALDVYSTEKAGKIHSIDFGKRVGAVAFVTDDVVLLAGDGGNVEVHNVKRKCVYHMFAAHAHRVKALRIVKVPGAAAADATFLVTAGSDGLVRVWHVDELDTNPRLLCEARCGCRITCMAIHSVHDEDDGLQKAKRKKKKKKSGASDVAGVLQGEGEDCENVNNDKRLSAGPTKSQTARESSDLEEAEAVANESEGEEEIQNASDGGDDEANEAEVTNTAQSRTKQKARKRKKKAVKEGDVKQMKVAVDMNSVRKEEADDKSLTKSARKRKRKAGKFKKQE